MTDRSRCCSKDIYLECELRLLFDPRGLKRDTLPLSAALQPDADNSIRSDNFSLPYVRPDVRGAVHNNCILVDPYLIGNVDRFILHLARFKVLQYVGFGDDRSEVVSSDNSFLYVAASPLRAACLCRSVKTLIDCAVLLPCPNAMLEEAKIDNGARRIRFIIFLLS
jgi:hypothetical protein